MMTKMERLKKTFAGEPTDRTPFSVYMHSTVHDRGVAEFTAYTLSFHKEYDPDYVKVMYDEVYDAPVNYQYAIDISVWKILEDLDPHKGAFGRYLEALKRIRDAIDPNTPVLATVFSPVHLAVRLAWKRLVQDLRQDPSQVVPGIETLARNQRAFVECALHETGIDGFFYGAYGCERDWLSQEEYQKYALPYDLHVLEGAQKAPFLILHIHGEKDSYFDLLKDYPCNALSWEDRLAGPTIAEARKKTKKCLVGGIDHHRARVASAEEVFREARDAIQQSGGRSFILAPGCTFLPGTPPENMRALRKACETVS